MYPMFAGQVDDWTPDEPVETDHDIDVSLINNYLWKAVHHDQIAHDLGHALYSIQLHCEGKKTEVLDPDDCDKMLRAVKLALRAAKHRVGDQCVFGELEDGAEAIAAQIYLWSLQPAERAKYSSDFRSRMRRNIRALRNALHNADIRLQNAKNEHKARDAEIIRKTVASLKKLGIELLK